MWQKIVCFSLVALLLVGVTACGDKPNEDVTTTTSTTTTAVEENTTVSTDEERSTTSKKDVGTTQKTTTDTTKKQTTTKDTTTVTTTTTAVKKTTATKTEKTTAKTTTTKVSDVTKTEKTTTTKAATTTKKGDSSAKDTKYATFRGGLPNTYAKLIKEKELTIAYIGGSITAGASAKPVSENSYRALTTAWFKAQFPDAKITEVNMGIGMAGSKLPAYYVKSQVVPKKPDLIFIECAINDYLERKIVTLEEVSAQYETIIRQLRTADPTCEFVALYTTNADVTSREKFFDQAETQDKIAAYYDIPAINIGRQLRSENFLREGRKSNGELTENWTQLFADDVHPNNDGHKLYAGYIADLLQTAFDDAATATPTVTSYTLPKAKNSNLLMGAEYITADKIDLSASPDWTYDAENGQIAATKSDSELTVTFTGTSLHFNCSGLPWGDVARASYSVDGGEWVTLQPCMIRAVPIVKDLAEGTHTIRFKCGVAPFTIAGLMVK